MTKYDINKENKLVNNCKITTNFDHSKADSRKNRAIAKKFAKIRQELNESIGISKNFRIPVKKTKSEDGNRVTMAASENVKEQLRNKDKSHENSFKKKETVPTPFLYRLAMESLNSK